MVAQGWFPVSTRSEKVASMGGPCLHLVGPGSERVWDCRGNKQDKGPDALEGRHLIRGIVLDLLTD